MQPLARDTHPEIERRQIALMESLPPWRKVQLIAELNMMLACLGAAAVDERAEADRWRVLHAKRLGPALAQVLARERQVRGVGLREEDAMAGNPIPALLAVIAAFDACGIEYFIGGSVASSVYGLYRATADVDVVARMTIGNAGRLCELLQGRFYADVELMQDAITTHSAFKLLDLETGAKIDVFVDPSDAYSQAQFARSRRLAITPDGTLAAVAGIEDIVLAKLRWYEAGGRASEQQWRDVLGVLRVQHDVVDRAYLRRWAAVLGLPNIVDQALAAAGEEDRRD